MIKLTPPASDGVYPRRRLLKELDRLRRHGAVWLAAPGGAGKTTLIASYLQERRLAPRQPAAVAAGAGCAPATPAPVLRVLVNGAITNAGRIEANGGGGSGGGAGGIVVFASPSVENTGTVDVSGGQGGVVTRLVNGTGVRAGGGGGGGSGGAGGSGASLSDGENSSGGFTGQPGFTLTLQQDPLFVVH
ncbi:hypothetical protein [Peristeroidobacter agariperforans]|uniref:hypothetical protein n=1 Tax=Peristeroidobacter agariperforans TaxID=268404 RepID=UPI00101D177E|nr:hypothetical protein [Peristeroidobacter agariperforans]